MEEIMKQLPHHEINWIGDKWEVLGEFDTFYHEQGVEAAALCYLFYCEIKQAEMN
jgi:hypothetical protein